MRVVSHKKKPVHGSREPQFLGGVDQVTASRIDPPPDAERFSVEVCVTINKYRCHWGTTLQELLTVLSGHQPGR